MQEADITINDYFHALRLHIASFDQSQVHQFISHVCDGRCEFTQYRNVFVCRSTGNVHLCGDRLCNRLIETADSRVCELTSISYALEYVLPVDITETHTINKVHFTSDNNHGHKLSTTRKRKRKLDLSKPTKEEQEEADDKNRQVKVKVNYSELYSKAYNIIKRSIRPEGIGKPDILDLNRVTNECLLLWEKIITTSSYQQMKGTYKFENHVIVVLLDMIDGVTFSDTILIKPNQALGKYMWNKRELKKKDNKFKIHCITNSSQIFHACLSETIHKMR